MTNVLIDSVKGRAPVDSAFVPCPRPRPILRVDSLATQRKPSISTVLCIILAWSVLVFAGTRRDVRGMLRCGVYPSPDTLISAEIYSYKPVGSVRGLLDSVRVTE
jgi:hypothetical protein